jgi:hypothetical protein
MLCNAASAKSAPRDQLTGNADHNGWILLRDRIALTAGAIKAFARAPVRTT